MRYSIISSNDTIGFGGLSCSTSTISIFKVDHDMLVCQLPKNSQSFLPGDEKKGYEPLFTSPSQAHPNENSRGLPAVAAKRRN